MKLECSNRLQKTNTWKVDKSDILLVASLAHVRRFSMQRLNAVDPGRLMIQGILKDFFGPSIN